MYQLRLDERGSAAKYILIALGVFVFLAIAVVVLLALAGVGLFFVASSAEGEPPGADVSNVTMSASNADPADPTYKIQSTWSARAQSAVDPDPGSLTQYSADDGEKYLVVRMQIENTGDESIELTPRLWQLETDGVVYDYQGLLGSGSMDATLRPDATYSGWVIFAIPEDTSEATLLVNQEAYYRENVTVSFENDRSMAINMSD